MLKTAAEFDFLDEWSLALTHVEVLLDLAIDVDGDGHGNALKRSTLYMCLETQVSRLRTLLKEQQEVCNEIGR